MKLCLARKRNLLLLRNLLLVFIGCHRGSPKLVVGPSRELAFCVTRCDPGGHGLPYLLDPPRFGSQVFLPLEHSLPCSVSLLSANVAATGDYFAYGDRDTFYTALVAFMKEDIGQRFESHIVFTEDETIEVFTEMSHHFRSSDMALSFFLDLHDFLSWRGACLTQLPLDCRTPSTGHSDADGTTKLS